MLLCLRIIFNDNAFGYFHLLAPLTSSPAPCTPPAPPASPPRAPPTAHPTCTSSQHILATTETEPTCQTHRRGSDFKWSQELDHWIRVHRHSRQKFQYGAWRLNWGAIEHRGGSPGSTRLPQIRPRHPIPAPRLLGRNNIWQVEQKVNIVFDSKSKLCFYRTQVRSKYESIKVPMSATD